MSAPDDESSPATGHVRRVRPEDLPAVVTLVYELAAYERAPEECTLTVDGLRSALFADDPAVFAHVAVLDDAVVGIAVWFLTFSTWTGTHGIHLEDLYVRETARRSGLGRGLLSALAAECERRGYARLEWSVLDWNRPALDFYASLGAVSMDEWTNQRVAGDALRGLARG